MLKECALWGIGCSNQLFLAKGHLYRSANTLQRWLQARSSEGQDDWALGYDLVTQPQVLQRTQRRAC
jgi:hypothetical protein